MGDRLRAVLPPRYVTKPTRSTQPCIPLGSLNRVLALIGWGKGGNITSAGWQVTLCDPMRHVSCRSGVVLVAQTAVSGYFTLLYFLFCSSHSRKNAPLLSYGHVTDRQTDGLITAQLSVPTVGGETNSRMWLRGYSCIVSSCSAASASQSLTYWLPSAASEACCTIKSRAVPGLSCCGFTLQTFA